jgi:hypothetical protein
MNLSFPVPRGRCRATALVAVALCIPFFAAADVVTLHSGRTIEGSVVSVDERWVQIDTESGRTRVEREKVASITFAEAAPPPLKVEVRNVRADDSIDVLFHDEVVIREARTAGSWVDLTPMLKDGNNPLRFRIRNERKTWGYVVHVRINGKVTRLDCGEPPDTRAPCTCCGKTGLETGIIDDLPPVWIYVDLGLGEAEVIP